MRRVKKDTDSCFRKLETWTKIRFPFLEKSLYQWSGQVLEPIDELAFIGRVKKKMRKYTRSISMAPKKTTFKASTIEEKMSAAKDFIQENVNTFCQYRDWMTPGDQKKVSKIPPNAGAIIRKGLDKCAIYRHSQGKLHEMSATCPHLNAKVRWNATEHCWECPAHGSRFSATGEVIQGPANCDLNHSH